ncbi:MAG: insulinase family protein [Betaproteobacteria bacterium]|nr:insulinase family protein [Betaproteobacteria bacterium]
MIDWHWARLLAAALACFAGAAQAKLEVDQWRAESGARVLFVEGRSIPMVDISVEFPAGSAYDPPGKSGLARLANDLLKAGSARTGEAELGRRFADIGAEIGHSFDRDRAGASLRTLSAARELNAAVAALAEMLSAPAFPQSAFAREKARLTAHVREAETRPDQLAERRLWALMYRGHPYGASPTSESVAAIERADVARFHRAHYWAEGAVVTIVGDLSRAQAAALAARITGPLVFSAEGSRAGGEASGRPGPVAPAGGGVVALPHPAGQSHLLLGLPAVARDDPDYFPLFVGNYVLGGGGFVSRLYSEVREKRGYAYNVYSYFQPLERPGPFLLGLQTRKDQTEEALAAARSVLEEFIARGPSEAELKAAKNGLGSGFPLRIDSNRKILAQLAMVGFYGLPVTWIEDFVANVRRVTLPEVKSAFARRIDLSRLATVIIGAPEK